MLRLTFHKLLLKFKKGSAKEFSMATVFDVAKYILEKRGRLTTWKLQKLCYYSQAWSLVWDGEPMFDERIEAWVNGPVIPALYERHKGKYYINDIIGDVTSLTKVQKETIDAVLDAYGEKTSNWLSLNTHGEAPWKRARQRAGLAIDERGNSVIPLDEMAEYYEGLSATTQENTTTQ